MIYAAPFLGEFGWLVCMWTPWLRKMCELSGGEMTVLCKSGQQALFTDFADVIPVNVWASKADCQNAWQGNHRLVADDYVRMTQHALAPLGREPRKHDILTPLDLQAVWPRNRPPRPARARHFRYQDGVQPYEKRIALHVRACPTKSPERNWNVGQAKRIGRELLGLGYQVYAIGSYDHAVCPGGNDARGMQLGTLMTMLAGCSAVIGPSSGPLHLANQCGTKALWWSANLKDVERYAKVWNPHRVDNKQVASSWTPTDKQILSSIILDLLRPAGS